MKLESLAAMLVRCLALGGAALLAACGGGSGTTAMNPLAQNSNLQSPPVNDKGLWIANGTNVLEYLPAQLTAGESAAAPHRMIISSCFGAPQGVTFDAHGNLWVMDPSGMVNGSPTPALFEFSAAQLAALGTNNAPTPVLTITSTALNFPQQSVFDQQGNQWVTDHNNNTVLVFTAAQLAQIGVATLTPQVMIASGSFNGPLGIVFDASGDLWIANNGGVPGGNGSMSAAGTTIVEFLAAHLPQPATSGTITPTLTPDVTLTTDAAESLQAPWALAFDAQGDLWASNANAPFTLVEFTVDSLLSSGTPTPVVTITPAMDAGIPTLNSPNGICFDNVGDLAAMNSAGAFGFVLFGANQLTSATSTPSVFIVGSATTLNAPAGCNFGPMIQ